MENKVVITGMGHWHPVHLLDNQFFESLEIDTSASWIEDRTGIRTRKSVLDQETIRRLRKGETSYRQLRKEKKLPLLTGMVDGAWEECVRRSGYRESPSVLVCGTSIADYHIPAQASFIAQKLMLKSLSFDAQSACSSFVTNLAVVKGLLSDNAMTSGAIFNAERYTTCLDFADRRSSVLFGDAATAALLQKGAGLRGLEILDIVMHSDPEGADLVQIPQDGFFAQNGARVQKFAISRTCEVTEEILHNNGYSTGDLSYFIGHQANLRMLTSACGKLGLSEDQHLHNVATCGNQGAAGAPAVLSQNWDKLKDGDLVVVSVVGSGLTWGSALLRFRSGN